MYTHYFNLEQNIRSNIIYERGFIMYSYTESYIYYLFKSIKIDGPYDLDMEIIADKLGAKIVYKDKPFYFDNEILMEQGTKRQEWMLFGHEMSHYLQHSGNQLAMHPLQVDHQENQANYFSYHFCVPTFMLERLKGVDIHVITRLFNVDYEFAYRRLEMYQSEIISGKEYQNGKLQETREKMAIYS